MTHRVEYIAQEDVVCRSPLIPTAREALEVARRGIERHKADSARIINGAGVVVELVHPKQ